MFDLFNESKLEFFSIPHLEIKRFEVGFLIVIVVLKWNINLKLNFSKGE